MGKNVIFEPRDLAHLKYENLGEHERFESDSEYAERMLEEISEEISEVVSVGRETNRLLMENNLEKKIESLNSTIAGIKQLLWFIAAILIGLAFK